jgi:hypothetical protein
MSFQSHTVGQPLFNTYAPVNPTVIAPLTTHTDDLLTNDEEVQSQDKEDEGTASEVLEGM